MRTVNRFATIFAASGLTQTAQRIGSVDLTDYLPDLDAAPNITAPGSFQLTIGGTPYANLYLGTGHGTLGWTMAAGTGRVLADLISGRQPEISLDGLTMARYPRAWTGRAAA